MISHNLSLHVPPTSSICVIYVYIHVYNRAGGGGGGGAGRGKERRRGVEGFRGGGEAEGGRENLIFQSTSVTFKQRKGPIAMLIAYYHNEVV